jgi:hypothetical protein
MSYLVFKMPYLKKNNFYLVVSKKRCIIAIVNWAFSSAGSEHLPYKQRVGGSNPSTPTTINTYNRVFSSAGSEHLPYKQRVGGSNPSIPTIIKKKIHSGYLAQLV